VQKHCRSKLARAISLANTVQATSCGKPVSDLMRTAFDLATLQGEDAALSHLHDWARLCACTGDRCLPELTMKVVDAAARSIDPDKIEDASVVKIMDMSSQLPCFNMEASWISSRMRSGAHSTKGYTATPGTRSCAPT
jgi:hypothetical protein